MILGMSIIILTMPHILYMSYQKALHYKKYSSASDVWSYGALMYEIWSVGHKPFENYSNKKAREIA